MVRFIFVTVNNGRPPGSSDIGQVEPGCAILAYADIVKKL